MYYVRTGFRTFIKLEQVRVPNENEYLITQRRDTRKLKKFVDYPRRAFFCTLMTLDLVFSECGNVQKKKKSSSPNEHKSKLEMASIFLFVK